MIGAVDPPPAAPLFLPTQPSRDDPFIITAIRNVILDLAERRGEVTADDVRDTMPNVPFKRSHMGAAFLSLRSEGRIHVIAYRCSRAPSNHGRRIQVYAPTQPIAPKPQGVAAHG